MTNRIPNWYGSSGSRLVPMLLGMLACGISSCGFSGLGEADSRSHGFMTRVHTDSSGERKRYVIFVPRDHEGRKLPVILFLNGQGENGDDGLRQICNNFGVDIWRKRDQFPFLAVCPQCSRNESWDPAGPNGRRAMAILDEVMREFDVDPDRVYLTGVSAGGSGVWRMAAAHPERFAAIVPISATGSQVAAETRLPVWGFYNGKDSRGVVEAGRAARAILIEAGLSPLMTEYDQLGHNAWHSYDNPFLYEWLLEQRRSDNAKRPPFVLRQPKSIVATWEQRGSGKWRVHQAREVMGISANSGDRAMLLCPDAFEAGEIHLDVHLAEDRASRLVFLSEKQEWLAELVVSLPTVGFGGLQLQRGDDRSFDPVGQRALRSGWNDIRISRRNGRLSVLLNGWRSLEMEDPFANRPVHWGLVANPGKSGSRWRYVRGISRSLTTEESG